MTMGSVSLLRETAHMTETSSSSGSVDSIAGVASAAPTIWAMKIRTYQQNNQVGLSLNPQSYSQLQKDDGGCSKSGLDLENPTEQSPLRNDIVPQTELLVLAVLEFD